MVAESHHEFDRLKNSILAISLFMSEKTTLFSSEKVESLSQKCYDKLVVEIENQFLAEKLEKDLADKIKRMVPKNKAKEQALKKIHEDAVEVAKKQSKQSVELEGAKFATQMKTEMVSNFSFVYNSFLQTQLKQRLFGIIEDNKTMRACAFDPEMTGCLLLSIIVISLAEIFYKLSLSFEDSPDLRVTWLINLSKKHKEVHNAEYFSANLNRWKTLRNVRKQKFLLLALLLHIYTCWIGSR